MNYPEMVEGRLIDRPNRFVVRVRLVSGELVTAYMPNTGRMGELMVPDFRIRLLPKNSPDRRHRFDAALVRLGKVWVSVNSHLANDLFQEALENHWMDEFQDLELVRREVTVGDSRMDFLLEGHSGQHYVEVKSCTLVDNGHCRFPDAPTIRGARHMRELAEQAKKGVGASVAFVIQRNDAKVWSPHWARDPEFAQSVVDASEAGVRVCAYKCAVGIKKILITDRVIVDLHG